MEYREVFEKLPEGVSIHDPDDGSFIDVNTQFCEMLGYDWEELLDAGFEKIHIGDPPFTAKRARQKVQQAADEGPQQFEWLDETKEGEPLPVDVNLRVTTIDGEERILALVRDISDRKEWERELEEKRSQLERFAGIISHDLRNPLNVISGSLQLLRDDGDPDHIERCERAIKRMDHLLNDLLQLARAGESVGELEPVNLDEVVKSAWKTMVTGDASLHSETEQIVRADRSRLQQLIENLFYNAVEHGGSSITVHVGELDSGSGFYIEDDGSGIPEERYDEIFEVGFSTSEQGTGYGLAIVEEIAEGHGWDVRVTESEDGGARFEVTNVETVAG